MKNTVALRNETLRLRASFWSSSAANLFAAAVLQFIVGCLVPLVAATVEVSNGMTQTVSINPQFMYALWIGGGVAGAVAVGFFARATHYLGLVVPDETAANWAQNGDVEGMSAQGQPN